MGDDRKAVELVERAFELPAEERCAFLDRACAGSPGLHAAVDSLLRAVEEASGIGLLPEPPEIAPSPATQTTSPPSGPADAKIISLSLAVGQQLVERYQVQRIIGVGGMGEVYHAIDQVLGRDVAIKVIRSPDSDAPRLAERFDRELKSVALLSHPNVVTLYDVADDKTSRFAVMEFVAGQTLRQRMSGELGWADVARIAYGVASGLSAAHTSGILHRDIKPENIMLTEAGLAKVLDFGIARPAAPETDPTVTGEGGQAIGTVPYMSPEQVNRQALTVATDVFSLGVVLYEALLGIHPFRADSALQTMRNIVEAPVDVAAGLSGKAPDELVRLIESMLGKDPGSRPSMSQVVERLKSLLGWRPQVITAGPSGSGETSRVERVASQDGPPRIAVLPFTTMTADPACQYFGDAVAQDLIVGLSRMRWLPVIARGSSFCFRSAGVDLGQAAKTLGADYLVTGSLEIDARRSVLSVELTNAAEGRVVWADRFEQALQDIMQYRFDVPLHILRSIEVGVQRAEAAKAADQAIDNLGAWSAYHRGLDHMFRFKADDNAQAAQLFRYALKQSPAFARAHAGLSFTYFQNAFLNLTGDFDQQCALAKQTAECAAEIDPLDPFVNLTLGRVGWLQGDLDTAGAWLNQSLQLNPSYAFARYNRALIDVMLSDAEASERNIEHAIRLSPIDPMSYAMQATQAMSNMLREDFKVAAACADQAIRHLTAHVHAFATATIANHLAGNNQRATELAGLIRQKQPDYGPADYFRSFPFRDSESARRMRSALQARLA